MLRRVTLVRTDISEELSASIIRVIRIGELGTTLAVTSNRRTLRRNISSQRASVASSPRGKRHRYPLHRRLGGPRTSLHSTEKWLALSGTEPGT
jgi:hypothetical protein